MIRYQYTGLQSRFRSANYTAFIKSKTEPPNGSKNENRSYGEAKNNKAMLKILSLIRTLYLKQQSNILRSFYSLFSNKFSVLYFTVR